MDLQSRSSEPTHHGRLELASFTQRDCGKTDKHPLELDSPWKKLSGVRAGPQRPPRGCVAVGDRAVCLQMEITASQMADEDR